MAGQVWTCPGCRASLKLNRAVAPGTRFRCPKCQTVVTATPPVEGPDDAEEAPRPAPARRRPADTEDDFDQEPRAARRRARPRDEDDDDDRPRRRRSKSNKGLILALVGGGTGVLVLGGVLLLIFLLGGSSSIVGRWELYEENGRPVPPGEEFYDFAADGSGSLNVRDEFPERFKYKQDGSTLILTRDDGRIERLRCRVSASTMTIEDDDVDDEDGGRLVQRYRRTR